MTTRQLVAAFGVALVALLLVAGILARVVGQQAASRPADGGRVISAPPPSLLTTQPIPGASAVKFHYLKPFHARDLPRTNLSTYIDAAAHHYGLSPVGLLSTVLSECRGYTHSTICDHVNYSYTPDTSFGCCQISVPTAAEFGLGNGVFDGYYGPNVTRVRNYENNPHNGIWLAARVLRDMRNRTGARYPDALPIWWNCGNMADYVYGTQCWINHQSFLQWFAIAATYGTNRRP